MEAWVTALGVFLATVVLVLWRPFRIHEAVPAVAGAFVLFLVGLIDRRDVLVVLAVVGNSALTIIATFIMAAVLDGAGFFDWASNRLIQRADGSGPRLFHLVLAFSAFLTLFLNNDGSILLGTPVVIGLVSRLRLSRKAAFPFLVGACLIASAASPPIGVSNMANLEAMSLVGITLLQHLRVVVLPALVGVAACWGLVYVTHRRDLPDLISEMEIIAPPDAIRPHRHVHHLDRPAPPPDPFPHRLPKPPLHEVEEPLPTPPIPPPPRHATSVRLRREPDAGFMWFGVGVIILVRAGFFVASLLSIPPFLVASAGALVLLAANLHRNVVDTRVALAQAPWAVLAFALGMDLVVFGLRNADITEWLAHTIGPAIHASSLAVSFLPGLVSAAISTLLNNHPGLITSALMLVDIGGLSHNTLHIAYSGIVLGSDLGALFTPIGTLASLMWFHILQQSGRRYSWADYLRTTLTVIPVSFLLSLVVLYGMALLM